MKPKKILILSASTGAGHVLAGAALEKTFAELEPDAQVKHFDTRDFTNKAFRKLYAQTYIMNEWYHIRMSLTFRANAILK